jgi:hypothetical protein
VLPITPFPNGVSEDSHSPTKHLVRLLLAEGWTVSEIASRLGLARSTICYQKATLGVRMDTRYARRYDWAEIRAYYEAGHSLRECQAEFGFSRGAWADAVARGDVTPRSNVVPIHEVLTTGSKRSRYHLKARLIKEGLKQNRCECCGIDEWLGEPLSLELHHTNGVGDDNRLSNLRILCPNCHSQTDTWGGRNAGRREAA